MKAILKAVGRLKFFFQGKTSQQDFGNPLLLMHDKGCRIIRQGVSYIFLDLTSIFEQQNFDGVCK